MFFVTSFTILLDFSCVDIVLIKLLIESMFWIERLGMFASLSLSVRFWTDFSVLS